jgi:LmbE family N-acetylglucosaminyl deacetylase
VGSVETAHRESQHFLLVLSPTRTIVVMIRRSPIHLAPKKLKILCVGAHSDDIEIGCGGTILRLLDEHPGSDVVWVVLTAREDRKKEAVRSATAFLRAAGSKKIITKPFRESYFPSEWEAIKDYFEELKALIDPDLVFTHYRQDSHQDHRVVCELTWNTFRCHQILEYEIPKYDGDLGQPNIYLPLTDETAKVKVNLLMKAFSTQRSRQWFSEDTFYALLRLRGIEANSSARYAEAYYGRKVVLDVGATVE